MSALAAHQALSALGDPLLDAEDLADLPNGQEARVLAAVTPPGNIHLVPVEVDDQLESCAPDAQA